MPNPIQHHNLDILNQALQRLGEALAHPLEEDDIVLDATIQRFEFCTELFWKTLKKFLAHEGIQATSPKDTLRRAYQIKWLQEETVWLDMLKDRNLTSHTYDQDEAMRIYQQVKQYHQAMQQVVETLTIRLSE